MDLISAGKRDYQHPLVSLRLIILFVCTDPSTNGTRRLFSLQKQVDKKCLELLTRPGWGDTATVKFRDRLMT